MSSVYGKVIRTYQQTFCGAEGYAWTFRWNKLYKQDPKNKFVISVISIASTEADIVVTPSQFYLRQNSGFNQYNANSSALSVDFADPAIENPAFQTNDWFIGTLGGWMDFTNVLQGNSSLFAPPQLLVDDLPVDNFTIYWRAANSGNAFVVETGVFSGIHCSFLIQEVAG
tara:strand:- start:12757 stop:13266 length:510 start_codon:yes stop_codon:yes gene_type:complete